MSAVVFFDDAVARTMEPFALTRPACEWRAGALVMRERWAALAPDTRRLRIGAPHLDHFAEPGTPKAAEGTVRAGSIIVNARFAPRLDARFGDPKTYAWRHDDRVVAVRLVDDCEADELPDLETLAVRLPTEVFEEQVDGWWIDHPWDLLRHLGDMLAADIPVLGGGMVTRHPATMADVRVLGAHPVIIENGATIEPFVILDAEAGPVLVQRGAVVQAFTRLRGPCAVGENTTIHGGRVANSSIGDHCRIHGEVNTTLWFGHTNKAHDGFVGHTVVGRWANFGAGTTTSNLKNSYGPVQLWTSAGTQNTGLQFLGSLIGDHVKLAIGTLLMTGTVVGAGANVFDQPAPRVIPPFSWGGGAQALFALDKFLQVTERVMERRGVTLEAGHRRALADAHARRWTVA